MKTGALIPDSHVLRKYWRLGRAFSLAAILLIACNPTPTPTPTPITPPPTIAPSPTLTPLPIVLPQIPLVRGYIAVSVGGTHIDAPASAQFPAHDVFLPNVSVFLTNASTGEKGNLVTTDLSGRFTLAVPKADRYQVCWEASGFIPDCSKDIISVSNAHVRVGTLYMSPDRSGGTTVIFGQVRFKDGSRPRLFEPLANVNAFAHVILLDRGGNALDKVFVNNFGEYLLPKVPVKVDITLRATIEGAASDQLILAGADLAQAPFHPIDLVIGNSPPRLEPLVSVDTNGRFVKTANPGDTINLEAHSSDPDQDPVKFRWFVSDGSGALSGTTTPQVTWTLPSEPGLYSVNVIAYDGRGGYTESIMSVRADTLGVPFTGQVEATDAPVVAGAEVEVNGQTTTTDAGGIFQLRVKDADRFILNIRKPGYALVSRIYDNSVTGGRWTMTRATVANVDPTRDIDVTNRRQSNDCPGPRASKLDWKSYSQLLEKPEWQDGKGNVVVPFANVKELPLPKPGQENRECGPGVRVQIPANSLQDEAGNPPTGNVDVAVSTVDLMSPEQMPGDYTVLLPSGDTQVMQSYGAGTIEISGGGKRYNLKPGSSAQVTIPVDPSQLATGGPLPPIIPILFYDEKNGVWIQEGDAPLVGTAYVAKVEHFSPINADTLKVNQSCVRVKSAPLSATYPTYNLEVTVPQGGGAAPKVFNRLMSSSSPSVDVIYNLPNNTNIVLVPTPIGSTTPIGTFVVNTGGPQNPTTPNLPNIGPVNGVYYPACSTEVTLESQVLPDEPVSGEFLQGLYSFEATNLNELNPADPSQNALRQALDQATTNYYHAIDPRGRRLTLNDFKTTNGFPTNEVRAIYTNSGDLGFGRDMHCTKQLSSDGQNDVACYVTNYGTILTPDSDDALAAVAGTNPVATVAMEYSRIEDPLPAGGSPTDPLVFSDSDRVVKFYVYNGAGTSLLNAADLDSGADAINGITPRPRPIPQLCMVCHNGEYPGGPITGAAPPFNSRNDVKLGSQFLPFDLHFYTFASAPNDKATQQAAFAQLNKDIVAATNPGAAIQEVITKMYQANPTQQDEYFVVPGWNATALEQRTYKDVIARACRTCHIANVFGSSPPTLPIQFDESSEVENLLGKVQNRVCVQHVMPHAKVTHRLFWTYVDTSNPSPDHLQALLQVFGDTFGNASNGWQPGSVNPNVQCGTFTAGGTTPLTFYQSTIQPIWDTHCTTCHTGATLCARMGLDTPRL